MFDFRSAGYVAHATAAPWVGGGVERRLVVTAQGDDVFAQAPVGRKDAHQKY